MDDVPNYQFDVMTPKTYLFGALMLLMGALGIIMMLAAPRTYPLLTLFFYNIASSAAIAIFPPEPVIIWFGRFVNLWSLTAVATAGTLVAMYLDYKFFVPVLNLAYSAKYKSKAGYQKARRWFDKSPFLIMTLAAFLPIPFYPFKFIALSAKYPLSKFLGAITLGRIPRYYLLALIGKAFQIPNWVLISLFLTMVMAIYYRKIWQWIKWPFVQLFKTGSRKMREAE